MKTSDIIIIGADSLIGKHLLYFYQDKRKVIATSKRKQSSYLYFDLEQPSFEKFTNFDYNSVGIICAAISKVDICEFQKEKSFCINVAGTKSLLSFFKEKKIFPVFLSSDYVFDGEVGDYTEQDNPNPITEYGKHKLFIEQFIQEVFDDNNFLILRLSKIFSLFAHHHTFITQIINDLLSQKKINAAYDQYFCPLLIDDLLAIIHEMLLKKITGIYHVCSSEKWNRYDLTRHIADNLSISDNLIKKISINDLPHQPIRPKDTSMINKKMLQTINISLSPIQKSIKTIIQELSADG